MLNTKQGVDLESILKHTHPLKIATAMEILYGSAHVVSSGQELVWYLMQGLQKNHFRAFIQTVHKE